MKRKYKCNTGIFSACESCKHGEKASNEKPCKACVKERKCPYFAFPGDCSGCRWEAKYEKKTLS